MSRHLFDDRAPAYARTRPTYPEALFDRLVALAPARGVAEAPLRLDDLLDFLRTWSASQEWMRERGSDPVELVRGDLTRAWGDPQIARAARWPLHGAIGRIR